MVLYTVIIGIIDFSVSWLLIEQDLSRTRGLLHVTMYLLKGI